MDNYLSIHINGFDDVLFMLYAALNARAIKVR